MLQNQFKQFFWKAVQKVAQSKYPPPNGFKSSPNGYTPKWLQISKSDSTECNLNFRRKKSTLWGLLSNGRLLWHGTTSRRWIWRRKLENELESLRSTGWLWRPPPPRSSTATTRIRGSTTNTTSGNRNWENWNSCKNRSRNSSKTW